MSAMFMKRKDMHWQFGTVWTNQCWCLLLWFQLNLSHTSSYFPPCCAEGMAILSFALSLFLIRERGSWRKYHIFVLLFWLFVLCYWTHSALRHTALFTMSSFALEIASGISKMFAQKKVTLSPGRHKIVILDEADRWVFMVV